MTMRSISLGLVQTMPSGLALMSSAEVARQLSKLGESGDLSRTDMGQLLLIESALLLSPGDRLAQHSELVTLQSFAR